MSVCGGVIHGDPWRWAKLKPLPYGEKQRITRWMKEQEKELPEPHEQSQ
jgi:hypothetical protein